jgi:predicted nucleotidyltransferase
MIESLPPAHRAVVAPVPKTILGCALVALPTFNDDGDLPPGVYQESLAAVLGRFGLGSQQRRAVASRLERIYRLAASTGQLARFVVFGSFVTAKAEPNDVDVVMLMENEFDLANVVTESRSLFEHLDAGVRFGASIFWSRRGGALGGEQAMIEHWQVRRDGGKRGIIEITSEEP